MDCAPSAENIISYKAREWTEESLQDNHNNASNLEYCTPCINVAMIFQVVTCV